MTREAWLLACEKLLTRWPAPSDITDADWRAQLWEALKKFRGEVYCRALQVVVDELVGDKTRGSARPSARYIARLVSEQVRTSWRPLEPRSPDEIREAAETLRRWRAERGWITMPGRVAREPGEDG